MAEMMQAEPEPPLPLTESFCREVLYKSFREFGAIPLASMNSRNAFNEYFLNLVDTVAPAVMCIQMLIRKKIRPLFIESMHLFVGINRGGAHQEIIEFMTQGYLEGDIYNRILSSLAVVAELFLFMFKMDIPLPYNWLAFPWAAIYRQEWETDLVSNGGLEMLAEVANRRYFDTGIYAEVYEPIVTAAPVPNEEVSTRDNVPDIPWLFLRQLGLHTMPRTQLAAHMLQRIYSHDPLIGEVFHRY